MSTFTALIWLCLIGFASGIGGGVGLGFVLIRQIDKRIAAINSALPFPRTDAPQTELDTEESR